MLGRLKREAKFTAILERLGIVSLYGMQQEETGEQLYFMMRKETGKTLK